MPNPIQPLTLAELQSALDAWTPLRKIRTVHVHCTDRPNHADFRGLASVEAMRRYHQSIGMTDIAQHLTVDPQGLLWTGRPFDAMPASARGHNGTHQAGPFMIEMVGLFDKGKDTFGGSQKASAQAVVCAVLRKFDLDESAVVFHNELLKPNKAGKKAKTCPGTALDPKTFRAEIRAALDSPVPSANVPAERSLRRHARAAFDRAALFGRGLEEDTAYAEVPEDAQSLQEQELLARFLEQGMLGPLGGASGRDVNPRYRDLLPYVVNTSQGLLSKKGEMESSPASLDALIRHHLLPALDAPAGHPARCEHVLFYAHGGLNSEEGALDYAKTMVPWWRSHGVYPIYFIWESSLLQAIWQRPRDLPGGAMPRGELGDKVLEGTTQLLARRIWRRMKANARRCSAPDAIDGEKGGLFQLWEKLEPELRGRKGRVKLHAIGHSTGPILLAQFTKLLIADGFEVDTLTYLAPAIRIDEFVAEVQPQLGNGIRRLRQYTMNDAAEREDRVARVYSKSLLYYVRQACEDDTDGRILGLEKDLYGNERMRGLFGLPARAGVLRAQSGGAGPDAGIEFAQPNDAFPENPYTRATAHGCFDNEQATMTSVLLDMQGKPFPTPFAPDPRFPWAGNSQCGGGDGSSRAAEDEELATSLGSMCCCCGAAAMDGGVGKAAPGGGGDDDFDAEGDDVAPAGPDGPGPADGDGAPAPGPGPGSGGRRLALCVGINEYPRQPLAGCVQDSRNWAAALRRSGFEVRELHDREATRAELVAGLRSLIRDGRPGDQLVFQYAGHGTQVDDETGDESDRVDEALVPVDFDQGALFVDDDLYDLCRELRPGVTLTFLMDCCHSGTNTRLAPSLARPRGGARPRFLVLSADDTAKHQELRKRMRAAPRASESAPLPGVVSVAACRDNEVAWEEEGQGNFSRHSMAVFDEVLRKGGSNRDFLDAVVAQFGEDRRQRPQLLEPAPGLERAKFLGGR